MSRSKTLLSLLMILAVSSGAIAEGQQQGPDYRHQLSLSGSFSTITQQTESSGTYSEPSDMYQLGFNGGYDHWVTDNISIGVKGKAITQWNDVSEDGFLDVLAVAKYHFVSDSRFVPYVGIQGGGTYSARTVSLSSSGVSDTFSSWGASVGGVAGVNIFLTEARDASLFIEYDFLYTQTD